MFAPDGHRITGGVGGKKMPPGTAPVIARRPANLSTATTSAQVQRIGCGCERHAERTSDDIAEVVVMAAAVRMID